MPEKIYVNLYVMDDIGFDDHGPISFVGVPRVGDNIELYFLEKNPGDYEVINVTWRTEVEEIDIVVRKTC